MRPPPDYADRADTRPLPIDTPDDFDTDDVRRDLRAASWAAAALVLAFGIAAGLIFGAFAP